MHVTDNPILLAVPVFFALIGVELLLSARRGLRTYRLGDSLCSLSLGILSQVSGVYGKALSVGLYSLALRHGALLSLSPRSPWVWLLALLGYDFCYYWAHRLGHEVNILWAAHVVHHSSEDYNLTTALRQTSSGFLLGWVFVLPMAVIGVPTLVMLVVSLVNLLYQYWIHTQLIGRLGWFDRWFASPSNHRVHHGQNDYCIDRNYGGMLMLWDHLFGSFVDERQDEPIVYGIRGQLASFNPIWANLHVYRDLWRGVTQAANWRERIQLLLRSPGWRPDGAARQTAKPRLETFSRFDPALTQGRQTWAMICFCLLFALGFLWLALQPSLPPMAALLGALALAAGLVGVARVTEGAAARTAHPRESLSQQIGGV